jgi:hypothetical protein
LNSTVGSNLFGPKRFPELWALINSANTRKGHK